MPINLKKKKILYKRKIYRIEKNCIKKYLDLVESTKNAKQIKMKQELIRKSQVHST